MRALVVLACFVALADCGGAIDPKQTAQTVEDALSCDRLGAQVIQDSKAAGKSCEEMRQAIVAAQGVFPRCAPYFAGVASFDCTGRDGGK